MINSYKTVLCEYRDEIIEKKSKFIATLRHVTTQEEAMSFIEEMRSEFWDATHNVYAYTLVDGNTKRYSDDGEPSGTSGVPSLNVLEGEGLLDVCVVITRYFGGTLLGTGGLVRAYSDSVKKVVESADIVNRYLCDKIVLSCDYNVWGKVMNYLSANAIPIGDVVYTDKVCAEVFEKVDLSDKLIADIIEKTDALCLCDKNEQLFINVGFDGKIIK